jgi:hypothetical protein
MRVLFPLHCLLHRLQLVVSVALEPSPSQGQASVEHAALEPFLALVHHLVPTAARVLGLRQARQYALLVMQEHGLGCLLVDVRFVVQDYFLRLWGLRHLPLALRVSLAGFQV